VSQIFGPYVVGEQDRDVLPPKPIAQERVNGGLRVKPVAQNCKNCCICHDFFPFLFWMN
jgi:hypothetical protein